MSNESKSQPVDRIILWPLTAAIWRQSGRNGTFYTFSVDRTYKNNADKLQSTASFGLNDALLLSKLADLVDTRIRQLQEIDAKNTRESNSAAA